jgi:predicted Zn-dependent protease
VDTARAIAQLQPENPDFKGLPAPQPIQNVAVFVERTANLTPEQRGRAVAVICRQAREKNLSASGAYATSSDEIAVANSLGLWAYHPGTVALIHTVMTAESGSAYASFATPDVSQVNPDTLARRAIERALRARDPIAVEPGEYTVLLEAEAVADLLEWFARLSFTAQAVQEERSFMRGQIGERVMGENITLWDDGLSTDAFAVPFDYEGVPKQKVVFVENGIARGVAYDSLTAGRDGCESTGHSLPAPNTFGPFPMHLFLAPGSASREEMIRSVERGILVTRFWYTRAVKPFDVTITGMTRDGTFLIENGQITRPVKNLRFTMSYLDALNRVRMIGRETKLTHEDWSGACFRVPDLVVDSWRFTGATQF